MRDQPNVLLITTDQQRPDSLGCYGAPVDTPSIDRLASTGVQFTNAFATMPSCAPSRGSLYTGRYPHRHGVYANGIPLPVTQRTLPDYLREAGYHTGLIGHWHLGSFDHGHHRAKFDDVLTTTSWDVPDGEDSDYVQYLNEAGYADGAAWRVLEDERKMGPSRIDAEHHESTWLADRSIEFLEDRATDDSPFYLHVSDLYPHFPIAPPEPYDAKYDPADVDLPETMDESFDGKPPLETSTTARRSFLDFTEEELREAWALYYGLCDHIDDQVGRVLDALRDLGLRDETIVVYTSDHGEMLGSHGLLWKGPFTYDEVMRIPLIVSHPSFEARRTEQLVSHVDLAPTLAEFAGEPMDDVDGRSVAPVAFGERSDTRTFVYGECSLQTETPVFMIRGRRFKYTVTVGQGAVLYDLDADPNERRNRAGDDAYRDVETTLRAELAERAPVNL